MSDAAADQTSTTIELPNQTQSGTEPLGNDPAIRSPDGTIKDPATKTTTADSTSSTTDQSKSTETKVDDKAKTETKDASAGAPEKYEAFTVPDGVKLDEKAIEAAQSIFKELNLSQEQAQKLVAFQAEQMKAGAEAGVKQYEDLRNEWRNETSKNKDLGDGNDLKPSVKANIGRALDLVLSADERKAFNEAADLTGAGDHPAILAAFNKLASRIGEGKLVNGSGPSPQGQPGRPKTGAQAMFPHLPSSAG